MWYRIAALLPILGLALVLGPGAAAAGEPSDRRIREYILNHPEVIVEALEKYRSRQRANQAQRNAEAITVNKEAIQNHPMTPVSGRADADVTIVEFFDYQCGFCKRALPTMLDIMKSDKGVRVVWKEFPILGPTSEFAARAAMAARKQGKYLPFHIRVMGSRGKLTPEKIFHLARKADLDIDRLKKDMDDPAIKKYLQDTIRLAQSIGINGTPAFIIGDKLVPGAIDKDRLMELIAQTRGRS